MSRWLALAEDTNSKSISLPDTPTKPDTIQLKGDKEGFCRVMSGCRVEGKEKDTALPSTPFQVGATNDKGKHLGKIAMQKIALCQHIEHGASHRADLIVKSGWSHTVTLKILNTLIRSGYVSESDNGVLSLNNITYQLINRLIQAGHLVVAGSHSRKGA
ncbi:hypothetical protein [Kiloniella sp.]|uniref:hypothetical protein n=1 Tax=Kiloniella sp. TaxID=1938587 RepID=UPI003B019507